MFGELFKKQAVEQTSEDRIKQLQAEVDVLSAAALSPGSGDDNSYNEDAVVALKKVQRELEDLQREMKK